jgi:hypothetical protein
VLATPSPPRSEKTLGVDDRGQGFRDPLHGEPKRKHDRHVAGHGERESYGGREGPLGHLEPDTGSKRGHDPSSGEDEKEPVGS